MWTLIILLGGMEPINQKIHSIPFSSKDHCIKAISELKDKIPSYKGLKYHCIKTGKESK